MAGDENCVERICKFRLAGNQVKPAKFRLALVCMKG
jgi:hypothetical protein